MPTKEQIRAMNECVQRLCVEAFTTRPGSLPHAIGALAVALQVLKDAARDNGIHPDHIAIASSGDAVEKLAAHLRESGVIRIDAVKPSG